MPLKRKMSSYEIAEHSGEIATAVSEARGTQMSHVAAFQHLQLKTINTPQGIHRAPHVNKQTNRCQKTASSQTLDGVTINA